MYRSPFTAKCEQTTPFKKAGSWAAGYHTGEDWICNTDRTLVSPADGTVSFVGYDSSYGNHIVIHTDDRKCILMAHLESTPTVKQGQHITAGTKVGMEGNTGNSTGYHLHIEVQSIPEWNYAENLLKPSDYIDFQKFTTVEPISTGSGFIARKYNNGSTREYTYLTTANSLASKNDIGYLDPYQTATVVARVDSCPAVIYDAQGKTKIGFVKWEGGVKEKNYSYKRWSNGSTPELVYSTVEDCKSGSNSVGKLFPNETADCCGIVNGCYALIYNAEGSKKVGFVKYNGGL